MKEVSISTWTEFRDIVDSHNYREWLYRGQNSSIFKLESSLFRVMKRNIELRSFGKKKSVILRKELYETEIINSFKRSSHLFLDSTPQKDKVFDWLSIMQHYGAPTRLLDFSFSPYVALFFAISGIKSEAAVYCIKYSDIKTIDEETYTKSNVDEKYKNIMKQTLNLHETLLMAYEPEHTNNRLMAQQGAFLIPNTLKFSHDEILENYTNDDFVYKLLIKEKIAFEFIERLAKLNLSFTNMYPGLEGFCKSFENVGIIPINRLRPISE